MPGRLARSIPVMATLVLAALGIGASTGAARAEDCLASPNSPAPKGSWWYYRLDWPTQRKCWYLRGFGGPAKQTAERETNQPLGSGSAPSEPTRPSDSSPSLPAADTATVGSIIQGAITPQASPGLQTGAPIAPPTQNDASVITRFTGRKGRRRIQELPVQETSASSQTDAERPELMTLKSHRRKQHLELWHTLHRPTMPLRCPTTTLRGLSEAASRPPMSSHRDSFSSS